MVYHPGAHIHRVTMNGLGAYPGLLDERYFVERREALGIVDRTAFGLDVHRAARRYMKPPIGGVTQIGCDIHIGRWPESHRQDERLSISRGNSAFQVHDPVKVSH